MSGKKEPFDAKALYALKPNEIDCPYNVASIKFCLDWSEKWKPQLSYCEKCRIRELAQFLVEVFAESKKVMGKLEAAKLTLLAQKALPKNAEAKTFKQLKRESEELRRNWRDKVNKNFFRNAPEREKAHSALEAFEDAKWVSEAFLVEVFAESKKVMGKLEAAKAAEKWATEVEKDQCMDECRIETHPVYLRLKEAQKALPKNAEELKQKVSDLVHQQWSKWQKYQNECVIHGQTTVEFTNSTWNRWNWLSRTKFEHLTTEEQRSDLEVAEEIWMPFLVEVFAESKKVMGKLEAAKMASDSAHITAQNALDAHHRVVEDKKELLAKLEAAQTILNEAIDELCKQRYAGCEFKIKDAIAVLGDGAVDGMAKT